MADSDMKGEPDRVHEQFSDPSSDVTFRSSDGVLFNLHCVNLSTHSVVFPGTETGGVMQCAHGEVVSLQEPARVLELLFEFIYPRQPRELDNHPFELISALAEAAEKYQLTAAMAVCRLHMRDNITDHPMEVLSYAAKHGYTSIANRAAPLTLDISLSTVLDILGPVHFKSWVMYRENWLGLYSTLGLDPATEPSQSSRSHTMQCSTKWFKFRLGVVSKLLDRLSNLLEIKRVISEHAKEIGPCSQCSDDMKAWRIALELRVSELPDFA